MSILIPDDFGFCKGVERAVSLAERYARSGEVFCLGNLIHNASVNQRLAEMGVIFKSDAKDIPDGAVVLTRCHGATKQETDKLTEKGCTIVDTVCPYVKKVRDTAAFYSDRGYTVLLFGDRDHDEVKGVCSYCDDVRVIKSTADIDALDPNKSYISVCQTTFDKDIYENLINYVKKSIKIFAIFNTICYTTSVRQEVCRKVSQKVDVTLVLGDGGSSNVSKLYAIAKKYCDNVFLIEKPDDIPNVEQNKNIGIIAGASTPRELIREVLIFMSETLNTEEIVVATAADESETKDVATETVVADATATAEPAEVAEEEDDQEKLMNKVSNAKVVEGRIYTCKVVKADDKGIVVAIGNMRKHDDKEEFVTIAIKKDGFVLPEDAVDNVADYNPADFPENFIFEARAIANKEKGFISFSKKAVDQVKAEEEALKAGEFKMKVAEVVSTYGVKGKVGDIEVFVPASQIKIGYVKPEDLEKYVGKELRLRVLEDDEKSEKRRSRRRSVRASQRVILLEEKKAREEAMWATLVEGAIVEGKVMRFSDWGAYVNVNGHDCLAHISELSNRRIAKPGDVLTIGETYQFKIIRVNREEGKVNLSYKALQKDPYDEFRETVPVGSVIEGTVERIKNYGAFVSIAPGVDGMIHISEISHDYVKDASQVLSVGQKVQVKVVAYGEDDKKRITLSIKQLTPAPEHPARNAEAAAEGEAAEDAPKASGQRIKKFENRKDAGAKIKREKKEDAPSQDYVEGSSQYSGFGALANMFSSDEAAADEAVAEETADDKTDAE